jgi:hypothetical protein
LGFGKGGDTVLLSIVGLLRSVIFEATDELLAELQPAEIPANATAKSKAVRIFIDLLS